MLPVLFHRALFAAALAGLSRSGIQLPPGRLPPQTDIVVLSRELRPYAVDVYLQACREHPGCLVVLVSRGDDWMTHPDGYLPVSEYELQTTAERLNPGREVVIVMGIEAACPEEGPDPETLPYD